jgi:hypothetical protein
MRRLTRFGLTVFVAGALSAGAASGALANYHIASPKGGSVVGNQVTQIKFQTQIGQALCNNNKVEGWLPTETAETLTVHPTFGGCTLAGLSTHYNTSDCNLTYGQTSKGEGERFDALMSVDCQSGKSIFMEDNWGVGCKLTIPPQKALSKVEFVNWFEGTMHAVYVVNGLSYSWTSQCPNSGGKSGSATDGKIRGEYGFSAFDPNGYKTSVWVD